MEYRITYLRDGRVLKVKTAISLAKWYSRHYKNRMLLAFFQRNGEGQNAWQRKKQENHEGNANGADDSWIDMISDFVGAY